jgi:hypothetical protein
MRKLVAIILVATLPVAATGCDALECGEGTIERDGTCAPATETPDPTTCGPGTQLGPSGTCESVVFCDPDTTMEVVDPITGEITCVGTGGGGDCSTELSGCATAAANTMTMCGRIYDIEDDAQIGMASTDTSACPADGEATGPCALTIHPYDALMFAANPTGTLPLSTEETYLDHCGRFRLKSIQPAGAPFIGLGVDDHPMHNNNRKLTGVAFPTQANTAKVDVVAYSTRESTDMMWGTTSGEGASLAALGVYVNIYRDNGTPGDPLSGNVAPGVQILRGGSMIPNDDYYFSNTGLNRTTVDPALTVTGANGTGLVLRQPNLGPYTGTAGPLPGGCTWYQSNGASIAGVVFVQIHNPVGSGCDF